MKGANLKEITFKMAKVISVYISTWCLLTMPIHAQMMGPMPQQQQLGGMPGAFQAFTQNVTSALIQAKMQTAGIQGMAQMYNNLQPQMGPSKFFPNCQVPAAVTGFPQNACSGVDSPGSLVQSENLAQVASSYAQYYEGLLTRATNKPAGVSQGLQCINDSKNALLSQIQQEINFLQARMNDIQELNQQFEENNRAALEELKRHNNLLHGGRLADIDNKTRDFKSLFDPSCQNIIGPEIMSTAKNRGLLQVRESMATREQSARNFQANRSKYERDLQAEVARIGREINNLGVDAIAENKILGTRSGRTQFKGFAAGVQRKVAEFNILREKVEGQVRKVDPNYSLPPMDDNFAVDFDLFVQRADDYFQKQYVDDCVTSRDKTYTGIDINNVLKNLRQNRTGNFGTAIGDYRQKLQSLLDQDAHIGDKLEAIKALDASYNNSISITFTDNSINSGGLKSSTPYFLFRDLVRNCEQRYAQDDTFSKDSRGRSHKEQVKRAKNYLKELKAAHSTLVSDIQNEVLNNVLNCNGATKSADKCNSENAFSPSDDNFCISHAGQCASEVQACYAQATGHVERVKTQMKTLTKQYNDNVGIFVAQQNQVLKSFRNKWIQSAERLRRFFPGAEYKMPQELLIAMPQPEMSEFGTELRGRGNLDFIKGLPTQLSKLQAALADQQVAVNNVVNEYISATEQAMNDNKSKWEGLAQQCTDQAEGFRKQIADQNQKSMEDYNKKIGELSEMCHNYQRLKNSSPVAGCEGDNSPSKLYGNASKVVGYMGYGGQEVLGQISQYEQVCGYHKEEENNEEEKDDAEQYKFASKCELGDWEDVVAEAEEKLLESVPSELRSKVESFIEGDTKYSSYFDEDERSVLDPLKVAMSGVRKMKNADYDVTKIELPFSVDTELSKEKQKEQKRILDEYQTLYSKNKNKSKNNYCEFAKLELHYEQAKSCSGRSSDTLKCYQDAKISVNDAEDAKMIERTFRMLDRKRKVASEDMWAQVTAMGQQKSDPCAAMTQTGRGLPQNMHSVNQMMNPGMPYMGIGR